MSRMIVEFKWLTKEQWMDYLIDFIRSSDKWISTYTNKINWVRTDVYKDEISKHRKSDRYQIVRF